MENSSAAKAYVAQRKSTPTWTIIFSRGAEPLAFLPTFTRRSEKLLRRSVVIGRRQFLYVTAEKRGGDTPRIPNATLKKLDYFHQSGNQKMLKDMLIALAADWEKRQVPQVQAFHMVQQLVHTAQASAAALGVRQDAVLEEVLETFSYAASYGDLMAALYAILFDDRFSKDKKLSPEDLYACAIRYIQDNYSEPISIMNVCGEIGISQTYLSRLFRKFGHTSFNAFLTQCRMENAMRLIREHPSILLRDVAACVGYDDSSYFSKVFHQATGRTPSQWAADPRTPSRNASETPSGGLPVS